MTLSLSLFSFADISCFFPSLFTEFRSKHHMLYFWLDLAEIERFPSTCMWSKKCSRVLWLTLFHFFFLCFSRTWTVDSDFLAAPGLFSGCWSYLPAVLASWLLLAAWLMIRARNKHRIQFLPLSWPGVKGTRFVLYERCSSARLFLQNSFSIVTWGWLLGKVNPVPVLVAQW